MYLAGACLIAMAVIGATLLPFIAGGYDPLATPIATMAWTFGRVSLLFVPLGALWLWVTLRNRAGTRAPGWLMWVTRSVCAVVSLVMIFVAFASSDSLLLTTAIAAMGILLNIRLARGLRAANSGTALSPFVPAITAVAPIVIFVAQAALVEPLTTYARNRAIANSAPLIAEIERHRQRRGVYPASLFALYGDYKPSVVGVERYYYEPSGAAYNVIFEEPSPVFGTRRFVVYNPRDEQRVTVHEQDRLRLEGAELDADNAGYTIIQPLPQPHWKVFLFLS